MFPSRSSKQGVLLKKAYISLCSLRIPWACIRCPFYRPKTSSLEQLVEGKANLLRMLEYVKLTEAERLLVTEGVELYQSLLEQEANTSTPHDLDSLRRAETKPIQIQGRHSNEKDRKGKPKVT